MRVPDTKPRKEHTSDISTAVPIGILQVQQPVKVTDGNPPAPGSTPEPWSIPVQTGATGPPGHHHSHVFQNEYVIGASMPALDCG